MDQGIGQDSAKTNEANYINIHTEYQITVQNVLYLFRITVEAAESR
jgi:hypothetical protein